MNNLEKKRDDDIFKINSRRLHGEIIVLLCIGGTGFYALLLLCIRDRSFLPLLYGFGYGISVLLMCISTVAIIDFISVKAKFIISNDNIRVYFFQIIRKKQYFKVKWQDINEIKVIEERHERTFAAGELWLVRETTGYKLKFFGPDGSKTIRLWCCRFPIRSQEKILNKLIEISNKKDKKVIKEKGSNKIIKLTDKGCMNIFSFIKEHFSSGWFPI